MKTEIEKFVKEVNELRKCDELDHEKISYTEGKNYYKIVTISKYNGKPGSAWAFIPKHDLINIKKPVKKGDLLKPASWSSPALHARGNILNNTAHFGIYGPVYLR